MHFGALLQSAIYLISSTLLYPAMVILLVAFIVIIISAGAFLAEWAQRARGKKTAYNDVKQMLCADKQPHGYQELVLEHLQEILGQAQPTWAEVENLWLAAKQRLWKRLDYLRILVRVGPSMGLICTLIPMTTGLAALSQGDMSRLSSDLVIAFSTTVVGLAVGVVAYVLYTIRARWLECDLEALQLIIESRAAAVLDNVEAR